VIHRAISIINDFYGEPNGLVEAGNSTIMLSYGKSSQLRDEPLLIYPVTK